MSAKSEAQSFTFAVEIILEVELRNGVKTARSDKDSTCLYLRFDL
jgi:hypothetical protein